jgi:uncharacterized repeat protein (TIGR01451 family)
MDTNQNNHMRAAEEAMPAKRSVPSKLRAIASKYASKYLFAGLTLATGSVLAGPGGVCTLTDFNTALQRTGTPAFAGAPGATNGDDSSETDSIVRTNDSYVYRFNYKVPSGKVENNITFSSTLPLTAGKKTVVWDGLPAQCDGVGSSVSADGLTLICNIGNQDRTTSGDLVAGVLAQVKATILGANNDVINVTTSVKTDDCSLGTVPDAPAPPVTISARQKVDFRKDVIYTQQSGYRFSSTSGGPEEDGYLVSWYVYMDQFDPAGSSSKGGQAINSPVSFTDTATNFPPGSIWFDCFRTSGDGQGDISCPPRYTSVGAGPGSNSTGGITITARPGEENEFLVAGGKNTDVQINPNTSQPQRLATFAVRYWIPLAAIQNTANQTPTGAGQIDLVNKIDSFVGTTNGATPAPLVDQRSTNNSLTNTVVATLPGSYYKYIARNWLGTVWNQTTYGGVNPGEYQLDGTQNWGDSGTALVYPGQVFFPRLDLYNPSASATTSTGSVNGPSSGISSILCENFDNTQVELAILPGSGGHAAGWYYGAASTIAFGSSGNANSTFPAGYKVEYGVANSGSGNPGKTSRCEDSDAQWFDTVTAAEAAGKKDLLNKVRMKIPSLGSGQNSLFVVAQKTRPGLNGTYIIDYTPVKAANIVGAGGVLGAWFDSSYTSRACTTCPPASGGSDNTGLSTGKRVQLTTALARVSKQAYSSLAALATNQPAGQAIANKTVTYVLTPSLQSIVPGLPPTFVTIQDRLPAPLTYVSGSASIPPDSVQTDAGGTTLSWTLNGVQPNTTLTTISFVALIPVDIPPNSSVNNLVYIDSPDDSSPLEQRRGDKALTVISPPGINVTKSTNTPLIEPNTTMTFKLAIANIEIAATTLDIIDVLPYVGDSTGVDQTPLAAQAGRTPVSNFAGTLKMNTGAVTVLSGGGASPVIRYSKKNPTTAGAGATALLIDPLAPNNAATVADGWCLVSEFGSSPNCPANIGEATAFRVSNYVLAGNSVGALQVQAQTNGNAIDNVYTNRFGIRSDNPGFNFLRSNDVPVRVVLGSISGKVYVDADGSATQGAPATEPPIPGTTVTLCAVDPALTGGVCPAGPATVATTTTGPGGTYTFNNLISRPYWIVETKPAGYANGPTNATGSAGGAATPNNFSAINLPIGTNASNYNFGHRLTDLVTTVDVPEAPVIPGSVVNATVTFGNVSQVPSENTTATIKLNPGLIGVVVTPPPGWTLLSPYNPATGEISFAPSNPGAQVTPGYSVNFPVSFNAPQTGTVTVTSSITNTIGDLTPINTPSSTDPKRNAHEKPITVIPQRVDVRKAVGTPRNLPGAELTALGIPVTEDVWLIPYRVTVGVSSSTLSITATNVQLVDDLRATFPQAALNPPVTIDRVIQTAPASLTGGELPGAFATASATNAPSCGIASAAYNGTSSFTMLPANVTLAPGQSCTVEFAVLVRYLTAANTPVVAQLNTAIGYSSLSPVPAPTFPTPGVPTFATQPDSVDKSTDRPDTTFPPVPGAFPPVPGTTGTPNGDTPDPTPVQLKPQVIDVRKSASAMTQTDLSGKKFRVFYTVNVKNNGAAGANALTNVQLSENLRFTFPAPAIYTATNVLAVVPASGAGNQGCGQTDLNAGFDGGFGYFTSGGANRNYNLIGTNGISTLALAQGKECVVSFQIDVDYGTSTPPSAAPQNRVFGSTAAGTNNDGPPFDQVTGTKAGDNPNLISKDTSTNLSPATTVFNAPPADPGAPTNAKSDTGSGSPAPLATLETVKSTTGPAVAMSDRKYRVPYEMTVVARGSASFVLPNVQAIDNLAQAFQGGPTITVLPAASQTVVAIGGATCPASIATVAIPNLTFFLGNTSLTVGTGCTFRFFVEVEYATPAAVVTTIQYNQVYATSIAGTTANPGGTIVVTPGTTSTTPFGPAGGNVAGTFTPPAGVLIAHDASTNGNTLPTSPAGDRPLPTPVQFAAPPTINAVKYARNITRPGAPITTGDTVEWTVIYKNDGTTVASNVQVTDVRQSGYSSSTLVSAARIPENTIEQIQPNAGYNGVGDTNLLFVTPATPVNLAPGDQLVFRINSVVSATVPGPVTNQASLTANELGGPGGTLVPTSAVDKGITQVCPSTNTCLPVGVTVPADTITSTSATPGTKGQPNSLPILPPNSISGKMYLDRNTDGVFNAGDTTPFPGTLITLCATSAVPCPTSQVRGTATTNATGDYGFTNVPPGNYFIQETQPAGYGSSTPNVRTVTMAGVAIANENFGETAASISGTVYRDNDGSGALNAGDAGIPAVTVRLCLSSDPACATPVTTTTTLSAGNIGSYTFADLPAPPAGQSYFIKEEQSTVPAGLNNGTTTLGTLPTAPGGGSVAGTADTPNSVVNGIRWTPSATPSTQPSATGTAYNFGELPTSSISGRVFLDSNFNGADNTEPGLPGTTTVTLCRSQPAHGVLCPPGDVVQTTTTTPGSGTYSFPSVTPGTYYVVETQPAGYASSNSNTSGPQVLSGGSNVTGVNFAETGAQLSGVVYKDTNYSGAVDPADLRLPNVTVRICTTPTCSASNPGSVVATTTTNASGTYAFNNLPAPPAGQQYYIVEDQTTVAQPSGVPLFDGTTTVGTFTTNGTGATTVPGTANQTPSRIDGLTWTPATTVVPGTASVVGQNFNFGEIEGVDIAGRVFYDKNRNGTQDTPATVDTGIGGVTMTLCRVAGVPCAGSNIVGTTTTAVNGDYSFARVPPGNYFVQESQPAGYGSTPTVSAPGVTDVRPITVTTANLTGIDFADTLSSLAGLVYLDNDGSQSRNGTEPTMPPGITITLSGTDVTGAPVTRTTVTNASGTYVFEDLKQGNYTVNETQPPNFGNGASHPGSTGGAGASNTNVITTIALPTGTDSVNNNFGDVPKTGAVSGSLWRDNDHDKVKDAGEPPLVGWTVELYRTPIGGGTPTLVTSVVTSGTGFYSIDGQEVGPGYSIRFVAPGGAVFGGAVNGETGTPIPGGSQVVRGELINLTLQPNTTIPQQSLPVDPAGVVYDSDTRLPVPGAQVTFAPIGSCPAYDPAIHLVGGVGNATQTVGADGFYQFLLNPGAPACQYGITVTPPAGYVPDPDVPPQATPLTPPNRPPNDPFLIVPNPGAPQLPDPTTWFQSFNLGPNSRDIVNNHVPLVSSNRPVLFISKLAAKTTVELGDNVKYTVKVKYVKGNAPLPVLRVVDSMPAGFKLIPGTSFVSVPTGAAPVAVPAGNILGAPGAVVTYNIPLPGGVFNVGQEMELTYRVRVGVGSLQGDGINRAQAGSTGAIRSNIAQAKVKVNPGVFTSDACIVGKIYVDCNNNHIQDAEEVGVPGVRLYLNDGTYMVSDSEGKYSICGLEPKSHVLKVDQITLPRGSRLTTTNNRNLGNADSLWLDLKNGEMQQADFAIGSCSNTVLEQVKARRSQGGVRSIDNERQGGTSLKFEGKNATYPDQGTDSANQPLLKPRPPGAPPPQSDAENNIRQTK